MVHAHTYHAARLERSASRCCHPGSLPPANRLGCGEGTRTARARGGAASRRRQMSSPSIQTLAALLAARRGRLSVGCDPSGPEARDGVARRHERWMPTHAPHARRVCVSTSYVCNATRPPARRMGAWAGLASPARPARGCSRLLEHWLGAAVAPGLRKGTGPLPAPPRHQAALGLVSR